MPFTEFVTPSLQQDTEARDAFLAQWPLSMKIVSAAAGAKKAFSGHMIRENNINVEASFKFVFSLEWESRQHFSSFISTDEFKEFIRAGIQPFIAGPPHPQSEEFTKAGIQPFITGPPDPQSQTQLYETDVSPVAVNSAPFIELFRISLEDEAKEIEVKKAWIVLVNALVYAGTSMPGLSGKSVNLDNSLYIGVVGWESLEEYDQAYLKLDIASAKTKLEALGGVSSFVASLAPC